MAKKMGKAKMLLIRESVGRNERKLDKILASNKSNDEKKRELAKVIKEFSDEMEDFGVNVKINDLKKEYYSKI